MLFHHFDFGDPTAVARFKLDISVHATTWEQYYDQYSYVLYKIIEKGLARQYPFNCRARPILFLLRHNLELCLKHNLSLQGREIPIQHDFKKLFDTFIDETAIPQGLKDAAKILDVDPDGAAFRYHSNKVDGRPYFTFQKIIEVAPIIEKYQDAEQSVVLTLLSIAPPFSYDTRKVKWDLTFHMGECRQLAHIRTQYDETIEFIIEGVVMDNWDINRLYLPLLFLIRHSLEIALKYNIGEIQKYAPDLIKNKDISNEHSLVTLYNIYRKFLEKLDLSKMDPSVKEQLDRYNQAYAQFNRQLHDLDINSRYFRFPVDKSGSPHHIDLKKIDLVEILKVYYDLDPFITFTNDVLEEQGLLCRYDWEY